MTTKQVAWVSVCAAIFIAAVAVGVTLRLTAQPTPPPVVTPYPNPPMPATLPTPMQVAAETPHAPASMQPAAVSPPEPSAVAARLANLRGEDLIAALWPMDIAAHGQPTYAQLQRNADRYSGQPAVFAGEVLEIQDVDQGTFIRLAIEDDYDRVLAVFALAHPDDSIVRGHHARAYGSLAGTFSYDSQAGWHITIPRLDAMAVVPTSVPRRAPRTSEIDHGRVPRCTRVRTYIRRGGAVVHSHSRRAARRRRH